MPTWTMVAFGLTVKPQNVVSGKDLHAHTDHMHGIYLRALRYIPLVRGRHTIVKEKKKKKKKTSDTKRFSGHCVLCFCPPRAVWTLSLRRWFYTQSVDSFSVISSHSLAPSRFEHLYFTVCHSPPPTQPYPHSPSPGTHTHTLFP